MKPIDQSILHSESTKGNCLAACVASLLEKNISEVPNFAEFDPRWEAALQDYLKREGLRALFIPFDENLDFWIADFGEHHLIFGDSPRGNFGHSVVGKGGQIVHDPHPSRAGLKKVKTWVFLVKI